MLLQKAKVITTPTAYSDGILHSVKPNVLENLLLQSNQFDTTWINVGTSETGGQSGYDGSSDAWLLTNTATNGRIEQNITQSSGIYTLSVYAKSGSASSIRLRVQGSLNNSADFDLTDGSNTPSANVISAKSTSIGGGWHRCEISVNDSITRVYFYAIGASNENIYIQDAQLNKGYSADQYVETTDVTSPRADFTFTRNSSATRVGEDGYIQDVQIIGGELTQNGDFEQIGSELVTNGNFATDSDWVKGTGWTISGGSANANVGNDVRLYQSGIGLQVGKTYLLKFDVLNYVSGGVDGFLGYTKSDGKIYATSNGSFEVYITPSNVSQDFVRFHSVGSFIGSIDNVSVKEVGQNWTFGGDWTMGDGKAVIDGSNSFLEQASTIEPSTLYRVSFTLSDYVSGSLRIALGGYGAGNYYSGNGIYTTDFLSDASSNTRIYFSAISSPNFSVDNISVKKITDDTNLPRINYEGFSYEETLGDNVVVNGTFDTDSNWTKGTGWSISGGKATCDGTQTSNSNLYQIIFAIGKTYKTTIDVNSINGTLKIFTGTGSAALTITSNGTYSVTQKADYSTVLYIEATPGTTLSIDNVSVKEVIGDLPIYGSGKGHFLLEGQSTNLVTYSEALENYSSGFSGSQIFNTTDLTPEGSNNARVLAYYGGTNQHYLSYTPSVTNGETYTFSVFLKKKELQYVALIFLNDFAGQFFDLENGTILGAISGGPINSKIEDYGNGWYRCSITDVATSTTKFSGVYLSEDGTGYGNITPTNTDGVYIYGFQIEQGNISSYIPTNGSAVTRAAETCNNAGNADLFDSSGVLYADIAALANDGTNRFISISDDAGANVVRLRYSTVDNEIKGWVKSAGVTSAVITASGLNILDFNKIAIRYKENDFSLWVNGMQIGTDTSGSAPTGLSDLEFDDGTGANDFYGKTKMVGVFPYLSNDEMECLTGEGYGTFQAMALANNYTVI